MKTGLSVSLSTILAVVGLIISLVGLAVALTKLVGVGPELVVSIVSVMTALFVGIISNYLTDIIQKRFIRAPRVFISYSSAESVAAQEIVDRLRQAGVKVWIDKENIHPGDDFRHVIENEIAKSDAVVTLMAGSTGSLRLRELNIAKERGIKIIPILLKEADIPESIRDIYYIDFRKEKQANLEELVKAVT